MLKPWSKRLNLTAQPIVWLDVERRKVDPEPALSTVLDGDQLVTYVHDERLRPAAESSGGGELAEFKSWTALVEDVLARVEQGALIAGYSTAELDLLTATRPERSEWISEHYLNANAGPWFRKHRPAVYAELNAKLPKDSFRKKVGLSDYLGVPEVKYHVPNRLDGFSPAETLKRVRDGLVRTDGSYGRLSEDLRVSWKNLIKYNQHDVKGMKHLTEFIHAQ